MHSISLSEARRIALQAQGLSQPNAFGGGAAGALAAIEHLGYVQIDTIAVVERAHHHVFWSRVNDYRPAMLEQLTKEKKVFEYWSHAASYLPMRDFRFSLPRKQRHASGEAHWFTPTTEYKRMRKKVLARIRAEGPLTARDFKDNKKRQGWFDRSPGKLALEQLWMEGALMIAGRKGFEKIYDLTERVLLSSVDISFPSAEEMARHLVSVALGAHGLIRADEISYLRKGMREPVQKICALMLKEGELEEVKVKGIERPYLILPGNSAAPLAKAIHILSPFDNKMIQRARVKELFGFDYMIECYVPEAKRKFGYFCLPVLEGEKFLGRIDAKANRQRGVLEIKSLHAEGKVDLRAKLEKIIVQFAEFNGCEEVEY